MATLKQVADGTAALLAYGVFPEEEIRFELDIAYAGDTDDPDPELVKVMKEAGWDYEETESCFTLGHPKETP